MKKQLAFFLITALTAGVSFAEISKPEAVDKAKAMVKELGMVRGAFSVVYPMD